MLLQGVSSTLKLTLILQVLALTASGHMMVPLLSLYFLLHRPQVMAGFTWKTNLTITTNFIFLWVLRILLLLPLIVVIDSTHLLVQTQPKWLPYLLELLFMVRIILLSTEVIFILPKVVIHLDPINII